MDHWSGVSLALSGTVSVIVIVASILAIRRKHASHVHNLWYIFSLVAFTFFMVFFYLYYTEQLYGFLGLPYSKHEYTFYERAFLWWLSISGDISGELELLSVIFLIVFVPQLMAFVVSGAFGCGSPPRFVGVVTKFLIISLIKFFSILGGLMFGRAAFFLILMGDLWGEGEEGALASGAKSLIMISVAFIMSVAYFNLNKFVVDARIRSSNPLIAYLTKYRQE